MLRSSPVSGHRSVSVRVGQTKSNVTGQEKRLKNPKPATVLTVFE
jgi:hypothetical protein